MTFGEFIWLYVLTLVLFALVDALWLGVIAKGLYKHHLKQRLAKPPNWFAAVVFYLLFILGLVYFAVAPALIYENAVDATVDGALYGLFTYATYQLTNWATLKGWPKDLVLVDLAWGVVASLTTATLSYVIFYGFN